MNIFLELFNVFDYINKKTYVTLYKLQNLNYKLQLNTVINCTTYYLIHSYPFINIY